MTTREQIEQEYRARRQAVEADYQKKLRELEEDGPQILGSILYEGKNKGQIEEAIKQDLRDDLDNLAFDKFRAIRDMEVWHSTPSPSRTNSPSS